MKKLLSVFLILMLLLSGCQSQQPAESTAQPDEDNATESLLPVLRIGVMSDVGAVPFVIADKMGYFKERGLPIEIEVFRSALDRDSALQTGNLDAVMADMLTIFFYNESQFNAKMIGRTYGNYIMVTNPILDLDDFKALPVHSIGLSSNTVIDFSTVKIAESNQFLKTLEKVAIPQMPVRLEMLKAGELSGATLPEPLASAAILEGGVRIGDTESFDLYPGIFIASADAIANNPEALKTLYEGYNEAVDYLNQTDVSEYFDFLVSELGFPEILKEQFVMPTFSHVDAPDETTFNKTYEWMKDEKLIEGSYSYDGLVDLSFISEP